MTAPVAAPVAPGRLGEAIPADALLGYLDGLRHWRDDRRGELDRLDAAALGAADPDALTADLALALSLWQAVSDRYDLMVTVWDSGRVLAPERERLSRLIWGRLDAGATPPGGGPTGLTVSLVEALTLVDAVIGRLRGRLTLDPGAGAGPRLAALRASVERCRDLVADAPGVAAPVDDLRARVDDLADRAGRGADVTGPLAALELDVARTERDLIVAAARQRDLVRDRERALDRRAALVAREGPLRALAERCADRIAGAPRLAVPHVDNLGPVPETAAELAGYETRLDRVAAALDHAGAAYAAPLAERDELRGRLGAYRSMAEAGLRAGEPAVAAAWQAARDILWSAPCDLEEARAAVARYQQAVRGGSPPPSRPEPV